MNALTALIAFAVLSAAGIFGLYLVKAGAPARASGKTFMSVLAVCVLTASLGAYAALGRYGDWQTAKVDTDVDYLLAGKITEARRRVELVPGDFQARYTLAQLLLEGSRYDEAVGVIDDCLKITGEQAAMLGLKAFAQYYRDGRQITADTRAVIERALARNPLEVQTRMLLGQDDFLNGRYAEAIVQWRKLLDSGVAPDKTRALQNAIRNAEARMGDKHN